MEIVMRNKFLNISFSFCFLFCFNVQAKQVKSIYDIKYHVKKYSKKKLVNSMRMLVYKGRPNRFFGTVGHKNIQDFIQATLKNYKLDTDTSVVADSFELNLDIGKALYQKDFDTKIVSSFKPNTPEYKKWNSFKNYMQSLLDKYSTQKGKNFIWQRNGTSGKTLIITAHYDTVSHDPKTLKINPQSKMPGADYNASGVGIALSLIDLLYDQKLHHSVRIVFLDAQSLGFLGSYDYAQKIKKEKENILGVVNLEMLGHDSKHFDKVKKYKNYKVYTRDTSTDSESLDVNFYNTFIKTTSKASVNIKFELTQNNFNNSDHFRFWDAGLPAIVLTQNWEDDFNTKYQSGNDFPETINQETYYNSFKFIARNTLGFLLNL